MLTESMEHFVHLAHSGSFYQAAKRSNMTVQGYSTMLSSLERELNTTLATRDRAGIHLTPAGTIFLNFCEMTLEHMADTIELIRKADGPSLGEESSAKIYMTHYCLQLTSFVRLISENVASSGIREEPFDNMLLRLENPEPDDVFFADLLPSTTQSKLEKRNITFEPLLHTIVGIAVRADSAIANKTKIEASKLDNIKLSHYPSRENNRIVAETFGGSLPTAINYEATSLDMLFEHTKSASDRGLITNSLGFFAMRSTKRFGAEELQFVPLAGTQAVVQIGFLHKKDRAASPQAESLMDSLREAVKELNASYLQEYPMIRELADHFE